MRVGYSPVRHARHSAERRPRRRRLEPVEREVGERGCADRLADVLHRTSERDQLLLVGEVDPVEARADDRRRRDADVHLGRAGVEEHLDDLARRVAADDRVVDDDDALPGDLRERVELQPDALLAERLVGLDERAADVAVLDQPLAERDPASRARTRSPPACPSRGSGGRGRPRPAPRRRAARPSARARRAPRRPRAGSRGARGRRTRRCRARRARGSTAWSDSTPVLVDDQRARRARPRARTRRRSGRARRSRRRSTQPSESRPRTSGRKPCGSRNASSLPSASAVTEYAPSSRRIVLTTASPSGCGSFAISAAISSVSEVDESFTSQPVAQLGRVDEIAVVADARPCARPRAGRSAARSPT